MSCRRIWIWIRSIANQEVTFISTWPPHPLQYTFWPFCMDLVERDVVLFCMRTSGEELLNINWFHCMKATIDVRKIGSMPPCPPSKFINQASKFDRPESNWKADRSPFIEIHLASLRWSLRYKLLNCFANTFTIVQILGENGVIACDDSTEWWLDFNENEN